MSVQHERIDEMVQQADRLRGAIHHELEILRMSHLVHHTRHMRDVPGHLREAEACIDRAMDDLCAAASAAQLGGRL